MAYKEIYPVLDFPLGSRVVDVGCGSGRFLAALGLRGIRAIGVERNRHYVEIGLARGFDIIPGAAEHLPLDDRSCDGLICNVALGYMDEPKAVAEWARVLKPGGEVRALLHGPGYALWLIVTAPFLKQKLYGVRMLLATLVYRTTGKRLGALIHTTKIMRTYYMALRLELVEVDESQRFAGQPVVIYHRLRKTGK